MAPSLKYVETYSEFKCPHCMMGIEMLIIGDSLIKQVGVKKLNKEDYDDCKS